jgi:uncharacterized membrane protein YsdA (DUF1294 family)
MSPNHSQYVQFAFCWYAAFSVVTLGAYWRDKMAAMSGRWRTRESTLHILALLGGWPGAWLGQRLAHHKSRKIFFQLLFWLTVAVNCSALYLLFSKLL